MSTDPPLRDLDIAIVGHACRVPGADSPDAFWQMIAEGREAIVDVDEDALRAAGVPNAELADPHYVRRAAIMRGVMGFDAGFFGLSALDAALLDPQHRHFLEVCWEALESAAYDPARFDGRIGVFGGVGMQGYFANHLLPNRSLMREHGLFLVRHTGNDKDFLPTRVSYEFDLRGPSVAVQTACSTSLVAIHVAAQSLLNMESDLALAGGVTIELPHGVGYTHVPGEILSPDGRCRSFDASAAGTVFGSGCGVVALRRGIDAYEDGDNILAVIRATAINNDGRRKVGYLAPSVDGQAAAVAEALELADVDPSEVGFIEAHGTATPVGDPIEVAALTEAFNDAPAGDRCVLGSVKSNIGHLDTAAGVAAVIKTTQALRHRVLPPTLHFDTPNPALGLDASPFHVLSRAQPWLGGTPRYACVNSIGVGGTNAHAVLTEAPARPTRHPASGPFWLPLSAKCPAALDEMRQRLAERLRADRELDLADVSFTLQEGRADFKHRAVFAGHTRTELIEALNRPVAAREATGHKQVVWAFAGGGAGSPGMAAVIYERFAVVRDEVDACLNTLNQLGAGDVRSALLDPAYSAAEFRRPSIALPSLMVAQLAVAAQLSAWGITPDVCVGHSMGEYTAACISGAMARSDALRIVLERGRLFETLAPGAMLSVNANIETLNQHTLGAVDVAADNAPSLTLASGSPTAIEALSARLTDAGIDHKPLRIDVAAHSRLLDPILPAFEDAVRRVSIGRPSLRVISTRLAAEVQDEWSTPSYWVDHLRRPVRFREAMNDALAGGPSLVFDVGPGRTMAALAAASTAWSDDDQSCQTLSREDAARGDARTTLAAFAAPWLQGAEIRWGDVRLAREHRRVALPTYPWQHREYSFDVPRPSGTVESSPDNLYAVATQPCAGERDALPEGAIVIAHAGRSFAPTSHGLDNALGSLQRLFPARRIVSVQTGTQTTRVGTRAWTLADTDDRVLQRLTARHGRIAAFVELREPEADIALIRAHALSASAAALATPLRVLFVQHTKASTSAGVYSGAAPVMRTELPHVSARLVDLSSAGPAPLTALRTELNRQDLSWTLWRDGVRHRRHAAAVRLPDAGDTDDATFLSTWDDSNVLLVSGGFGGIAQALLDGLATARPGLRVALLSRTGLPPLTQGDAADDRKGSEDPYADRREAVARLERKGCRVVVHAVDVRDADAVADVTRAVEHELGPIGCVLHTAGRLDDALIGTRSDAELLAVLSPKVEGAKNLIAALSHRPTAQFVAFSSTSAFAGLAGQLSYAAANAWLDTYVRQLSADGRPAMSLAWPAWRQTGMAANRLAALRGDYGSPSVAGPGARVLERGAHALTLRITLQESDWVLADHRLRDGGAVLPGAALLAYAYGAYQELNADTACSLRDVVFEQPVFVHNSRGLTLTISETQWRVDGDDGTTYCRGAYGQPEASSPPTPPFPKLALRSADAGAHAHMLFGERWQCVEGFAHDDHVRWTSLRLPPAFASDLDDWCVHPALLDFAIAGGVSLSDQASFFVPFSIERVDVRGALPAACYSRVALVSEQRDVLVFDAAVASQSGETLVEVSGFTQRAVSDVAALVRRSTADTFVDAAGALERALQSGIDNQTGVRAFMGAVQPGGPSHIVVGTSPPTLEPAAAAAVAQAAVTTVSHAVANSMQGGSAPTSPTEIFVASLWTQLLGAPITDVDADFFALGGHSLNAIRLVSRLNDALGTSLVMGALFECPTVRALSELVDAQTNAAHRPDSVAQADARDVAFSDSTLPLVSPAQRGIWLQERSAPQGAAFHVAAAYALSGTIDVQALAQAVEALANRHSALRSRFPAVNGLPTVVVSPPGAVSLAHARGDCTVGWHDRAAAEPFDLENGPLCRVILGNAPESGEDNRLLLIVVHHIVCDEWSLEVMVRELGELYAAATHRADEQPSARDLPPAPDVFAAYARADSLASAPDGRVEALEGAPTVLALPHDQATISNQERAGRRIVRRAPDTVGTALRTFASDTGVSVFVSALAVYAAFVARWSGQHDVLIGTPASSRDTQALESAVGLFIDTVVVRAELDDSPSLTTLAARVRDDVLRAFDEERVPFGELVRALGGSRTPGVHPLYQTMLAVYPVERSLRLGDANATPLHVDAGGAQVDLTLYVADHGDALEWIAEYDTNLFAAATIERALLRLEDFILAATHQPNRSLFAIHALPDAEHDALVDWGAGSERDRGAEDLVLPRVMEHDASRKTAVIAGGRSLTYRQLASIRKRAATQLIDSGVQPGQTVAVALTRRAELPAVLLAIWEVGAAYLPVDPSFPKERIEWMLRDSGATCLYTESSLVETMPSDLPELLLESLPERAARRPSPTADADATAYVIYTSGSTGKPKGVQVPHGAVANFVVSMLREPGIDASDHLLAVTTISFDISVLEVFAPLVAGASLTVASGAETRDAFALLQLLAERRTTVLQATPATWRMLLAAGWTGADVKALCGGEPLPRDLAHALLSRVAELWNMYGPTETTVWSTCTRILDAAERISIGRPIDNTHIAITDDTGRRQPIGVPGELLIGGAGLATGYLNRPALTQQRFPELPLITEAGARRSDDTPESRWYRTGDIARWTHDGQLEHLGRSDAQVKLRGFRIELGEIEAVAATTADVAEVAVSVFDFGAGDARLVGFFVGGEEACAEAIIAVCSAALPDYMVPRQWVPLNRLPLTPNGKLDRKSLSPPTRAPVHERAEARSEAERWLAGVWADLLGADAVRRSDNFFDVGGHSLLSMSLIHEVETTTGVRLNPLQLSTQTLAQIAATLPLDQARPADDDVAERAIHVAPEFVDAPGGQRFMLHTRPSSPPRGALLLVPPLLHEVQASARSMRVLAERGAAAGIHAARLDFAGTGDSAGHLHEVRLADWENDLVAACGALRRASGIEHLTILAPRLAAALVCRVAPQLGPTSIILWSPVMEGATLLEQLRREDAQWREHEARERPSARRMFDHSLLGLSMSAELLSDLEALSQTRPPKATRVLVHNGETWPPRTLASASDGSVQAVTIESESPWLAGGDMDHAPVAVDAVDAVLRLVREA